MRKPGRVDVAELIVKGIENQSANNQTEHDQRQHCRMEHPDQHSHMVDGKEDRAEEVSKFYTHILFQCDEPEPTEEKFLKERIHDGYVDYHPYEVVRRDTHTGGQTCGNAAKINDAAQSEVSAEDDTEDGKTQQKRYQKPFLFESEQGLEFAPFLTPYHKEQHREREEEQDFDRYLGEIRRMHKGIYEGYSEGENDEG